MKTQLFLHLFILLFAAFTCGCKMQSKIVTDGNERYYDEGGTKVLNPDFWGENKFIDIRQNTLLVRLDQDNEKIAAWIKDGHLKRANKLKAMYDNRNKEVVNAFKQYYKPNKYFFYYAGDAKKIFEEKRFEYLYEDLTQKAGPVDLSKAYVLMYRTTPEMKEGKRFVLHHWNGHKVERLRGHYHYREYKNFISPKVDYKKTIRIFSDTVWN